MWHYKGCWKKLPERSNTRRLFFALWPGRELRQTISQTLMPRLQGLSGRKLSQQQWHITLAFLGNVPDEMADCVQQQAQTISAAPFDITLETVGYWSRPKVVWLGAGDIPDGLQSLVSDLNTALKPCGYAPEYPDFKAHMTLMRKVTRKPKPFPVRPITWHVDQFVLVESRVDSSGSQYKIVQRWPLVVRTP
ncbi:MAG: RNA 2',3'-cyclic phosphodiesterase [Gammaproteobacteria bacterium]